jgi:hypothetical protein
MRVADQAIFIGAVFMLNCLTLGSATAAVRFQPDYVGNLHTLAPFLSAKTTIIRGEVIETHDRIAPEPQAGITWKRTFSVTLAANQVRETWVNELQGQGGKQNSGRDDPNGTSQSFLGANSGKKLWTVLGENQLQRVYSRGNYISLMTITIGHSHECQVEWKYLTKEGVQMTPDEPGDSSGSTRYTPYRLVNANCTIE